MESCHNLRVDEADKYLSTAEGLEFAKLIADKLGMEFDREATRKEADEMHDLYFGAIVRITGLDPTLLKFKAAAYRNLNAYVPVSSEAQGRVFFDEQLDAWLLCCTTLITIMACESLDGNEVRALVSAFIANLDVAINPYLHERNRKRLRGFMYRHAESMPIAVPLRRAMVVFILCHEIGHVLALHHLEGTQPSIATEREADRIAAGLYMKIVQAGVEAHPVSVHKKLAAAPILMTLCLDLIRRRRAQRGIPSRSSGVHPSGQERAAFLLEALTPVLDEADYVLRGFSAALNDLIELAELKYVE